MAAPTVTRPTAVVDQPSSSSTIDWVRYAKWALVAAIALTAVGVVSFFYSAHVEEKYADDCRKQWDAYYTTTKPADEEDSTIEDKIEVLEKACEVPALQGKAPHGFALMRLGNIHFNMGISPRKSPEFRRDELVRAEKVFELLATTEPFKSQSDFGMPALQALCATYEQQQVAATDNTERYDKAISLLRPALFQAGDSEPLPVAAAKTHFLFDKMTAQLGRLYWLRSLREDAMKKTDAAAADRAQALYFVKTSLESGLSSAEKEMGDRLKAAWREDAAYIKSLLDKSGKMIVDGKIPAAKPEPEKKDDAKKDDAKKAEPAADKPKADAPKADKPNEEPKPKAEEPKKMGSLSLESPAPLAADDTGAPQHMSYAQLQQMLKQGKPALCQCPRCVGANDSKLIGAKLSE
jgi:hypothetical protein